MSIDKEALFGDNRIFISAPVTTGGERSSVFQYRRALINDPWEVISLLQVLDAGRAKRGHVALGRDIDVRANELAIAAGPTSGPARFVYSNEVPLFVGNFGG